MLLGLRCVISVLGAILGPASGFLSVELFGTPGSGSHVACALLVPPKALAEALVPKALVSDNNTISVVGGVMRATSITNREYVL